MSVFRSVCLSAAALLVLPGLVAPLMIHVDADNTSGPWEGTTNHPYQYIQDGVDAASNGDTVYVSGGTYYENVVIDRSIVVLGQSRDSTVVDGGGNDDVVHVGGGAGSVTITGFTIQNSGDAAYPHYDSGIELRSDSSTIADNNIINNNCKGIFLWHSDFSVVANNNVTGNSTKGIHLSDSRNNFISVNNVASNGGKGIGIGYSSDNTVTGNIVTGNANRGIHIGDSSHGTVSGNTIADNEKEGIHLYRASDCTVRDNTLLSNGIGIKGSSLEYWNTHLIENNTADGYPIRYYRDVQDVIVPESTAQVILANCSNFTIENLDFSNVSSGIVLGFSEGNTISGNTTSHNDVCGIYLAFSVDNLLFDNNISDNGTGVYLDNGVNTHSNRIYHNSFVNNSQNAYGLGDNSWDCRYPEGGNYWGDYAGEDDYRGLNQDMVGDDGIGDIAHAISGDSTFDWYPLMEPWSGISPVPPHPFIHVDDDNTEGPWDGTVENPYQTIGEGMGAADNDYTVYVWGGTYDEEFTVTKTVTLTGEARRESTIVVGSGSYPVVSVWASSTYVAGFTIQGGTVGMEVFSDHTTITSNGLRGNQEALHLHSSSNKVHSNVVTDNLSTGIHLSSPSGGNLITSNIINSPDGQRNILLESSDGNWFANNTIENCDYGIDLYSSDSNSITNNGVSLSGHTGINLESSRDNSIFENDIESNLYGLYLNSSDSNAIHDNFILQNSYYGIVLASSYGNLIHNNYFNNTANANDDGVNVWSTSYDCSSQVNIIGEPCTGGNFWHDYSGADDGSGEWPHNLAYDGIGDTDLPYNSGGSVQNGGDHLPLVYRADLFVRGDANGDGAVTMQDALFLLRALYVGGPLPPCMDAADANDREDQPTMGDAMYVLRYLYTPGHAPPPPPFPDCGPDPTTDDMDCNSHPCMNRSARAGI